MSFATGYHLKEGTLENIKGAIFQQLQPGSHVLGSKLGFLIAHLIAPLTLKQFGGLKLFTRDYLDDVVDPAGAVPSDDVYLVRKPQGPEASPPAGWRDASSVPNTTLWPAFSNPNVPAYFAVPATKDALLYSPARQPPDQGCSELEKLTSEDYKHLATDFISSLPPAQYQQAHDIVTGPSFAQHWTVFLRAQCGVDKVRDWETKRVSWVVEQLDAKLKDAGVNDDIRKVLTERLKRSRESIRAPKQTRASLRDSPTSIAATHTLFPVRPNPDLPSQEVQHDLGKLRNTLHLAIDSMSLDELRALRIPLGVLIDSMR